MRRSGPPRQRGVRYEPPEKPPHLLSLGLGLQLVMLNNSGIVLIPKIIIEAAGTGETYLTWAVFAGLCVCGAVTILQSVRVGRMGAGYIPPDGDLRHLRCRFDHGPAGGRPCSVGHLDRGLVAVSLGSRLVLLRRYATSVSHRQYHDSDVVTVRVDADKAA